MWNEKHQKQIRYNLAFECSFEWGPLQSISHKAWHLLETIELYILELYDLNQTKSISCSNKQKSTKSKNIPSPKIEKLARQLGRVTFKAKASNEQSCAQCALYTEHSAMSLTFELYYLSHSLSRKSLPFLFAVLSVCEQICVCELIQ